MRRTLERYARCSPSAVAGGSEAQMRFFVEDAKADIAELHAALKAAAEGLVQDDMPMTYALVRRVLDAAERGT